MVRRFRPGTELPSETVRDLVGCATRAPSAGFSQGWDFIALLDEGDRARFWSAASTPGADSAWLHGVAAAPALIICLSDPGAYLDRYAEPDKGWSDRSIAHWPVPYWDTDVGMAAMLILLRAVDLGLGALFFGVPADRHEQVKEAHGIPTGHRIIGVVAVGQEEYAVSGSARTRRRRSVDEVLHTGHFGASQR